MVLSMIASALRSCHLGCLRYGTKPLGVPAPAVERRIVHGSASISIFIVAVIVLSSCLHNDLDWLSSGRLRNPAFPHLGSHFKQEKVVLTIVHPSVHPSIDRSMAHGASSSWQVGIKTREHYGQPSSSRSTS